MIQPGITIYGAYWCPDCRRSKQFLGEHQIPYRWVDIEQDKAGEAYVLAKHAGKRIIPTIEFADGTLLVEPSNAALAAKLGLKLTAERSHYDLIVVGGGPAGLTAALYAAREGIAALVIERAALGGQAAATERLDNMPGVVEGIEGAKFADQLRQQAARFGVEMLQAQDVVDVHSHDNYHCVATADGSEYSARALLLATGSRYRRLGAPGENDFIGAGIHFCATCDGPFYKGLPVAVLGGGNSAAEESLFLASLSEKVTLLVRGDRLKASQVIQEKVLRHPKIEVRFNTEVVRFDGAGGKLKAVTIRDSQAASTEVIHPAGVFVFIGLTPNTGFLNPEQLRRDRSGFLVTGHDLVHDGARPRGFEKREPGLLETSLPGIFAAGDVRAGSTKQVAAATGEGATAALLIREYLKAA
ncbi:MAG: FAD-dependent oxidoreductase [bacterium]|jgi:thioredoxin reductase (NADPH)|nr:FAD-dependent oxidoreductase [candidate division KSB1 bacterium]MDH7561349.1 FAD-dependent oxidoreductase [bacterium]